MPKRNKGVYMRMILIGYLGLGFFIHAEANERILDFVSNNEILHVNACTPTEEAHGYRTSKSIREFCSINHRTGEQTCGKHMWIECK